MSDQYDSTGWYHQNGWRRDCTGKWHPPDRSPGPGWQIADDGVWYPPRGWWLASDGSWYPPQASPRLPEVSKLEVSRRSTRAARVAQTASVAAVATFALGLSVGLLGGDDNAPAAVGVVALVLMAPSLGLGCMALIVAVRGLRPQPDGARSRGFAPALVIAILVVLIGLRLWSLLIEEGSPEIVHVALGLDVLLGAVAGLLWPLEVKPQHSHS